MSTILKLIHTSPFTVAQLESILQLQNQSSGINNFERYLNGFVSGSRKGTLSCNIGEIQATGKLVLAGQPTDEDTFSVANVSFAAETSGAGSNEFNIGTSITQTAANIAASVNASTSANKIVSATSTAGTVTFTAVSAGNSGNGLQLSSALTNGTAGLVGFTGGTTGTTFNLNPHN